MTVHDEFSERVAQVEAELAGLPTIKHLLAGLSGVKGRLFKRFMGLWGGRVSAN